MLPQQSEGKNLQSVNSISKKYYQTTSIGVEPATESDNHGRSTTVNQGFQFYNQTEPQEPPIKQEFQQYSES